MRFGVTLPVFSEWSDLGTVMDVAADAEAAGWDGSFLWDHVTWNPAWGGTPPMAEPWLCLAAAATVTSRVTLGPIVTPLPRRRPQVVAREVVTLDHLSGGRALLGVGLGDDFEFEAFGEPLGDRGSRLDEAQTVLTALSSGAAVDFEGEHTVVHSPPAFTIEDLEALRALVGRDDDFDYVMSGLTESPNDNEAIHAWEAAGATRWLEAIHPFGGAAPRMRDRMRAGPPNL